MFQLKYFSFSRLSFIVLLGALAFGQTPAKAAEVIRTFHSLIEVQKNGDLIVTETITVKAEGRKIKRGIYRDFPLYFRDDYGRSRRVAFDIISIKRDGKPDDYHTEKGSNFIRTYIGNKDVYLPSGDYEYQIKYRTDRQLRFFESHDELYWNVTGTEWELPIELAVAVVRLPEGVTAERTFLFTGEYGSLETDGIAQIASGGQSVEFATTKPLGDREGLSIGVAMPKGSFVNRTDGIEYWWRDFAAEIVGSIGLIITGFFYFFRWWQVGRDPPTGIVVPRWELPADISPALTDYIHSKGFGAKAYRALTSALLNLAVKGHIEVDAQSADLEIIRTDKRATPDLPVGEAAILKFLDRRKSDRLIAKKKHGKSIKAMHDRFMQAVENEHREAFYKHNLGSIALGFGLSILSIFAVLATGAINEDVFFLIIPTIILAVIAVVIIYNVLPILSSGGLMSKGKGLLRLSGIGVIFFVIAFRGGAFLTEYLTQPYLLGLMAALIILNGAFFILMGAPTPLGREKMDMIEGLHQYIDLAEKDRMNLAGAPTMSPQHYETLLPYAVALGLEKPWSNTFKAWLATAAAATVAASYYGPRWYRGEFSADRLEDNVGSLASSMEKSFTASLPQPKSSSSGFSSGGGFSGGGGGGGGGGGW